MEGGQGLSATWSAHSDLPHRCRAGCNSSLTECQKSPRDVFLQELSHLNGPNFFGVNILPIMRDAVFWDVSGDFLRIRQRTDPLVVIELLRGRAFFFLQEHLLCVEQESALFRQVSRRPLDCESVKTPKQAPPLASSCEGGNGIQVFLPFISGTGQRSDACFAPFLLPHRSTPSGPRRGTLRTGGMSSNARAPRNKGCGPVPAAWILGLSEHRLASRTVRLSVAAPLLLFCEVAQSIADPWTLEIRSVMCPDFPFGISARQRYRQRGAQDWCALMAPSRLCPSHDVARDHTSRECHRRGPTKLGEQMLLSVSQSDVPGGGGQFSGLSSIGSPGGTGCEL